MHSKVLRFWFGEISPCVDGNMKLWFGKADAVDQQIISEFMDIHQQLFQNPYALGNEPDQLLASIIVLDQFSRNMFRGSSQSFAADDKALELTKAVHSIIQNGQASHFGKYEKMFAYMPLMHSESLKEQQFGVEVFDKLASEFEDMSSVSNYMKKHAAIVELFGRFPHRNEVLGRESTPEEIEFLKTEGSSF